MSLFSKPKIEGTELEECLVYFENECKITAFQTREADLYNDVLERYGNLLSNDKRAATEVCEASRRLVQAAEEIIRRHESIAHIPQQASSLYAAWNVTFQANKAWATATLAAIQPTTTGSSINSFDTMSVQLRFAEYQKAWQKAQEEDRKFVKRLKTTPNEIDRILSESNAHAVNDTWEP